MCQPIAPPKLGYIFTDVTTKGPEITTTRTIDESHTLTAIVAHDNGETIFCGHENGDVIAYASKTGLPTQQLFSHGNNVGILVLVWNGTASLLISEDRYVCSTLVIAVIVLCSGRRHGGMFQLWTHKCLARSTDGSTKVALLTLKSHHRSGLIMVHQISVACNQTLKVSEDLLGHKSAFPARQLLLSPLGTRFLVSMLDTDELWDLESKSVVASVTADVECERTWANDPSQNDRLLLATEGILKIFAWETLTEVTEPRSVIHSSSMSHPFYPVRFNYLT